jgi:tRNA 2-thiouridine synthesizing protein A
MAVHQLDTLGLKCPQPILRIAQFIPKCEPGDVIEVLSDCPSFPKDIVAWTEKTGRTLLFCMDDGTGKCTTQIQL